MKGTTPWPGTTISDRARQLAMLERAVGKLLIDKDGIDLSMSPGAITNELLSPGYKVAGISGLPCEALQTVVYGPWVSHHSLYLCLGMQSGIALRDSNKWFALWNPVEDGSFSWFSIHPHCKYLKDNEVRDAIRIMDEFAAMCESYRNFSRKGQD